MQRSACLRSAICVIALVLVATACSSEPSDIIVGVSEDAAANSVPIDATDDGPVADDSPPEAYTTTTVGPTLPPPESVAPQTTFLAGPSKYEVLGPAMIGVGEWVVIRPTSDPDDECSDGVLGFQVDGDLVHLYEEMSFAGGIRLFNGTRGQDAFVLNCEESVTAVWLQGSAVMTDTGFPFLTEIDFGDDLAGSEPWFEFLADWGWRGDIFAGFGSIGGVSDLWSFGIADAVTVPLGEVIGQRQPARDDLQISIVAPRGWTHEATSEGELVEHPASSSRVQVWTVDGSPEPQLEEGDELLSHDTTPIRTWSTPNPGAPAEPGFPVPVDQWTFLSPDGVRVVTYVGRADETVVIELFADSGDGSIDQDLPWLVFDTLRIFEN